MDSNLPLLGSQIPIAAKRAGGAGPPGVEAPTASPSQRRGKAVADSIELKESRLKEWYQSALRAQATNDIEKAASLYEKVLDSELFRDEVDPETGEVRPNTTILSVEGARLKFLTLKNLGDLQVSNGLKDAALRNLLKAVDCDDTDLKVLVQLGKLAMEQGESSLARTVLGRALQLQPSYWPAIENYMVNAYILGDWELCNSLIEGALKLDPNWIQGYILQRRCQAHITHSDVHSTDSSSTNAHRGSSSAQRSREAVIETLASLPASITNIPLPTLKLLLQSLSQQDMLDAPALEELNMLRKTPSKLWSPGPSFGSPLLSSTHHRNTSNISGLATTHFTESIPLHPAAIGLPPTMLMGLQSRVDMHSRSIEAGFTDNEGYEMDIDDPQDLLVLDPQVESRVTSLCDWLENIDILQTNTSNRVTWPSSTRKTNAGSASLNGPPIAAVEVSLDPANLTLEELLISLQEQVERLADDAEEGVSAQSQVQFFCDGYAVTDELKRVLFGHRHYNSVSDSTMAILEQVITAEELRADLGLESEEDQQSDSLSQADHFSDRAMHMTENTQSLMDEDADRTDDEESEGPPVSRSSSRLAAATRSSGSLKPAPKRTASKLKPKAEDEEEEEEDASEAGDEATNSSAKSGRGAKRGSASSGANASTKTSLTNEALEPWLQKLFEALDLNGARPYAAQVLGPNLIPSDSLPSFESDASASEKDLHARATRSQADAEAEAAAEEKPLAVPNEKLYVLRLVSAHLQSLPLTRALYLVVYHIAHLWHSCSFGKRLAGRLQESIALLRSIQLELDLSPPPSGLLQLQTLLPLSSEHYDHLRLPFLPLFLAEAAIGKGKRGSSAQTTSALLEELTDCAPRLLLDESISEAEKQGSGTGRKKRSAGPSSLKKLRVIDPTDFESLSLAQIDYGEGFEPSDKSGVDESYCYRRSDEKTSHLPNQLTVLRLTQLTQNEWNYFVRLIWIQLSQLMEDFTSRTMQIRPIWFGAPGKEDEDSLSNASLPAMQYRVDALRALLQYRSKVINPIEVEVAANTAKTDAAPSAASIASFTDAAKKSLLDTLEVPNMPQFWSKVSGKALEDISNILSKLAVLQTQRAAQREKRKQVQAVVDVDCPGAAISAVNAVEDATNLAAAPGIGDSGASVGDAKPAEADANQNRNASANAPAVSVESIEQEFKDESLSPGAATQRRRYFLLLRRGCRFFTHESRTELALHAFASFVGFADIQSAWRPKLVDIIEHIVNAGVENVESVNNVESYAVRSALAVCSRGRESELLAVSEPRPPSEFVAELISCVLCMFTQLFRAEYIVNIEAQPKNSVNLPRLSAVTQLAHFLSLPIVRNFFHWSYIHEGHNSIINATLAASFASSKSSLSSLYHAGGGRGRGRKQNSQSSAKLTESSTSVVSEASSTGDSDTKDETSLFSPQLSRQFELAQVSVQSMLRDLAPVMTSVPLPANRKKAKAKYAHILSSYFWLLRSTVVPKLVDTKLLLDYLWVAHLNLSQDDICYAGDGVLLVTSMRFVNEIEDILEALAKRKKRKPAAPKASQASSSKSNSSTSNGESGLAVLAFDSAAFDDVPEIEAEAFSYSPLLKIESLEVHRVFGDEDSEVTTEASKFVESNKGEDLDDLKTEIADAVIPESGTSTLAATSLAHWQISRMRHELLHRCTCCLYHVELPVPSSLRIESAAGKPHRQTRKGSHMNYFGLPIHDYANSLAPIVTANDTVEAGAITAYSSEIAAKYSMEALWKYFGPNAIIEAPKPRKRGSKAKGTTKKAKWTYGSDEVDNQKEPEKFAQRFALYHLHAASGSLAIRSPAELAVEDGYHLFRYLEGLLLEKANVKGQTKMQEISSFIYSLFAHGPLIAPKTVATNHRVAQLGDWLRKSHFDIEQDWSRIPTARSYTPESDEFASTMIVDDSGEQGSKFAENDSFTKDLDFRACKRYSGVYDNIFYMRARSAIQEANTMHSSSLALLLLLRQIYVRPHHVMALLELSQQSHWLLQYRMSTGDVTSSFSPTEDAIDADSKGLFFLSVRSVLLAAKVLSHYHAERDSKVELKGLKLAVTSDQKSELAFVTKIARVFPWMPMSCFEGEDSTFWINARKHLISVLWKGSSWFEGSEAKIALLSQAKLLCVRWIDFDPAIVSTSAAQSGLWTVSYLKGRVQEELTNARFPMKDQHSHPLKRISFSSYSSPPCGLWTVEIDASLNASTSKSLREALTIDLDDVARIIPLSRNGSTGLERWSDEVSSFPYDDLKADLAHKWLMRRLIVASEAMEDYEQALTSTPAHRSAALDARYRLHKWRLELVLQLYDPDLAPFISKEYISEVQKLIESSPPSDNVSPLFSSSDFSSYFTALPNTIFLQPTPEAPSPVIPPLVPLPAHEFFESTLGPTSHDSVDEIKESMLDSALTGLRECLEVKKALKHVKTIYLLARLISGLKAPHLHATTKKLLKNALDKSFANTTPTMSSIEGRIIDRTASLELSSHLLNFKALAPKMQFWCPFGDDAPEYLRSERMVTLQSKHLCFVLRLLEQLLADHLPHMWDPAPDYSANSASPPPGSNGEEASAAGEESAAATPTAAPKGPQPVQTRGGSRGSKSHQPEAPKSLLAPSLRVFLSVCAYLDNILERIAVDDMNSKTGTREISARFTIRVLPLLVDAIRRAAASGAAIAALVPTPTILSLLKIACLSYRLTRELEDVELLLPAIRALLSLFGLIHALSPGLLELTDEQVAEFNVDACGALPLEAALAKLQPVLFLLKKAIGLDLPDAIKQVIPPGAVQQGPSGTTGFASGEHAWNPNDPNQSRSAGNAGDAGSANRRGPKAKRSAKANTTAAPVQPNYLPQQQVQAMPHQDHLQEMLLSRPDILHHLASTGQLSPAQYMMITGYNQLMHPAAQQMMQSMPMMMGPGGMLNFAPYMVPQGHIPQQIPMMMHPNQSVMDLTQDSDEE